MRVSPREAGLHVSAWSIEPIDPGPVLTVKLVSLESFGLCVLRLFSS